MALDTVRTYHPPEPCPCDVAHAAASTPAPQDQYSLVACGVRREAQDRRGGQHGVLAVGADARRLSRGDEDGSAARERCCSRAPVTREAANGVRPPQPGWSTATVGCPRARRGSA